MSCRLLIIAGGESSRWGGHAGVRHKHLLRVGDQTLLGRQIEQLGPLFDEVTVVGRSGDQAPGATAFYIPGPHGRSMFEGGKFYDSHPLWLDRDGFTMFTFGDVWFSDDAVATIARQTGTARRGNERAWHPGGCLAFGRYAASSFTGKPYGELFALGIFGSHGGTRRVFDELERQMEQRLRGSLGRNAGWELYRGLTPGLDPAGEHQISPTNFVEIDDLTEDFDFAIDFERWKLANQGAAASAQA